MWILMSPIFIPTILTSKVALQRIISVAFELVLEILCFGLSLTS